jgi:hypothetical protein
MKSKKVFPLQHNGFCSRLLVSYDFALVLGDMVQNLDDPPQETTNFRWNLEFPHLFPSVFIPSPELDVSKFLAR